MKIYFISLDKALENIFMLFLYMLMLAIIGMITILFRLDEINYSAILIGTSALTTSIAISRSVYSTKISDKKKIDIEMYKDRLEFYSDLVEIVLMLQRLNTYKSEVKNKLNKLYGKS